ncbi:MAG: LUD domain-containing protein [Micromonosporaceae bacterium]
MTGPGGATAREEILRRLREALGEPADHPRPAAAVPRDYRTVDDAAVDRLALLADRLVDYRATVHRTTGADLASAVATALAGARTVVVPPDLPAAWLAGWRGEVVRDLDPDPLPVTDLDAPGVSVLTGCAVAVADTGTLVLDTGPHQGRRVLTLVPDHHVCVVRADQVAVSVPAALARLADPRRPLTFVSGPSATSDIELDRVEGVHGPRRLDVILVE